MRVRKNPMTPLATVVADLLSGATGTVCLDAIHYLKYRRAVPLGHQPGPLQETADPRLMPATVDSLLAPLKFG